MEGSYYYYVLLAGTTFFFRSVGSIRHEGAFATVSLANVGSWTLQRTYSYVPPDISCYLSSHSTMPPQTWICFLLSCLDEVENQAFFTLARIVWYETQQLVGHLAILLLIGLPKLLNSHWLPKVEK